MRRALAFALLLSCAHTPQEAPPVKPPTPLRWQGELVRGVVKACEGANARICAIIERPTEGF